MKLQKKFFIFFTLISLIPLIILFILFSTQVKSQLENKIRSDLESSSEQVSLMLEEIIMHRIEDIQLLSKNPIIISSKSSIHEKLKELNKVNDLHKDYDDITLITPDGNVITSTSYNYRGEFLTQSWFNKVIEENTLVVSDAHIIPDPFRLIIISAVPVYNEKGILEAVLAAQFDMKDIEDLTRNLTIGYSGGFYLVNNQGRLLTPYNKKEILDKVEPVLQECTGGSRMYKNEEDITLIEGYSPLLGDVIYKGEGCWKIVAVQEEKDAFSIINTIKKQFLIMVPLILLISLSLGFFISRRISKPITQLQKATQELEKRNFKTRVDIKTKDELEDLGESFNKTTEALGGLDKKQKQIEKAKTEFLSITSHELRSPMTPIKAQLQMLEKGIFGKLNSKQKESLETVLRNTNRLDRIIVDFLEISRIESARLKFNFIKIDLIKPVKQLIKEMENFLPEKNIQIVLDVGKLPVTEVDVDRVMQVLGNLINNAKKFSKSNNKIFVNVKLKDNMILFSVKDQGIGISEEDKKRLFEPFFQAEKTMYRKYGGVGLGLTISKGIVEAQKGKIWVESEKGKGSVFYFTIPLKPVKEIEPFRVLFAPKKPSEDKEKEISEEELAKKDLIKGEEKKSPKKIIDKKVIEK